MTALYKLRPGLGKVWPLFILYLGYTSPDFQAIEITIIGTKFFSPNNMPATTLAFVSAHQQPAC